MFDHSRDPFTAVKEAFPRLELGPALDRQPGAAATGLRNVFGFMVTDEQWQLLLAFGGSPETADILNGSSDAGDDAFDEDMIAKILTGMFAAR